MKFLDCNRQDACTTTHQTFAQWIREKKWVNLIGLFLSVIIFVGVLGAGLTKFLGENGFWWLNTIDGIYGTYAIAGIGLLLIWGWLNYTTAGQLWQIRQDLRYWTLHLLYNQSQVLQEPQESQARYQDRKSQKRYDQIILQ